MLVVGDHPRAAEKGLDFVHFVVYWGVYCVYGKKGLAVQNINEILVCYDDLLLGVLEVHEE